MTYISSKEAAAKWGVSLRLVQRLLHEGRIDGAKKYGAAWMIPAGVIKPDDPRRPQPCGSKQKDYIYLAAIDMTRGDPEGRSQNLPEGFETLLRADIAYRQGNPAKAMEYFRSVDDDDETKLTAASLAAVAAMSAGDYAMYHEVKEYLHRARKNEKDDRALALISLPETVAAVCMSAPGLTPRWLREMDFSLFPDELTPFLLFLYTLHLRNIGDSRSSLAVARTSLALCEKAETYTWIDLNNYVLCAASHYALGDRKQAERDLCAGLELGMPAGLIAAFADNLSMMGGLMEKCVTRLFPERWQSLNDLWESSFKNWIVFHNTYTRENITTILTAQEHQVAHLAVNGATYKEIAEHMHLSLGRVKNILTDIYGKLFIKKKSRLKDFVS